MLIVCGKYDNIRAKGLIRMSENILYVYCDGACRGNQSRINVGGWGVFMEYRNHTKELYGSTENTSNQKMELYACISALKNIKRKDVTIEVITDSQYVVKGITEWIHNWKKRNWHNSKGDPVENQNLWHELSALKETFTDIRFKHCKGHSNVKGNIKADFLANLGMDEKQKIGVN